MQQIFRPVLFEFLHNLSFQAASSRCGALRSSAAGLPDGVFPSGVMLFETGKLPSDIFPRRGALRSTDADLPAGAFSELCFSRPVIIQAFKRHPLAVVLPLFGSSNPLFISKPGDHPVTSSVAFYRLTDEP